MAFSQRDVDRVVEILSAAAQAEILPRFRAIGYDDPRQKTSRLDLVTDADEAAERHIAAALTTAFPGVLVLGEEACSADMGLLDRLGGSGLAMIIDPIDGTKNFASGLPLFGVMAGVVEGGEIVAGVILDPITWTWTVGLRGVGAWTQDRAGTRTDLKVSHGRPVGEMAGLVSWIFMAEPLRSRVLRGMGRTAGASDYRCAAHQYRMLAGGHADYLLAGKMMPWDHTAGSLIHREAGGYAARFDGAPYDPRVHAGGLLCAPDEASWRALHAVLLGPED
jgi:fructose-1,6-bisphosphatase/inositol monophosphatase family enzyme